MDRNAARTPRSLVNEATVELSSSQRQAVQPSRADSLQDECARVCLVEGSGPELTREIAVLLRGRLRIAATILAAGFALFLVSHVLQADFAEGAGVFLFGLHVATAVLLGAVAAMLCHRCNIPMGWLRLAELVVFGLPLLFFLAMAYLITLHYAVLPAPYFNFPTGPWLLLMFVYALFIPNSLARASLVIGLLAAAPVGLFVFLAFFHPEVGAVVRVADIIGFPLMILVSATASVFGVDTIGHLRREAFEARQLGQYRLKRRIGAGGMGEVYLAEHLLLKRPCVVKLIRPQIAGEARVLARFQREVRATARLSHWNTVEIFDYGSTEDGTFYYVMEYLPGMSLAELVRRFGPQPPERVVYLLRQVCDALSEAHTAGLIHRDIKPGNIFAAQRGGVYDVAKLLDFGLVRPIIEDQPVHLTAVGAITGSPLFMSPEQAIGEAADIRSDVYSLGAVGYYLLTGQPPFVSDKPIKVMIAHAHEKVVPPSQLCPGVPSDLEQVILRSLAKAPANRFQDATELAEALAGCACADHWNRSKAAEWWQQIEPSERICGDGAE